MPIRLTVRPSTEAMATYLFMGHGSRGRDGDGVQCCRMQLKTYLLEVRNPDGTVVQIGSLKSATDDLAKKAIGKRVRGYRGELNPYADIVLREKSSGRSVYGDDDAPTVEELQAIPRIYGGLAELRSID